jgi:hypothetical protein
MRDGMGIRLRMHAIGPGAANGRGLADGRGVTGIRRLRAWLRFG